MKLSWVMRIDKIEERKSQSYLSGIGKDAVFTVVSTGWWITTDDNVSHCVGADRPLAKVGGQIKFSMEF